MDTVWNGNEKWSSRDHSQPPCCSATLTQPGMPQLLGKVSRQTEIGWTSLQQMLRGDSGIHTAAVGAATACVCFECVHCYMLACMLEGRSFERRDLSHRVGTACVTERVQDHSVFLETSADSLTAVGRPCMYIRQCRGKCQPVNPKCHTYTPSWS